MRDPYVQLLESQSAMSMLMMQMVREAASISGGHGDYPLAHALFIMPCCQPGHQELVA